MVHNYSRRTIAAVLVAPLLTLPIVTAAGAEGGEIELTIGTSGLDPLSQEKAMGSGPFCALGQRIVMPNRLITAIGYRVWKVGSPTGDVVLSIKDYATGNAIVSVVWGDASELPIPAAGGIQKVRLNEPVRVNGEVAICVEYYGGNMTDYCVAGYRTGNYRDGETYVNYSHYGSWLDIGEAEEGGYYYAYVDEGVVDPPPNGNGNGSGPNDTVSIPDWLVIGLAAGIPIASSMLAVHFTKKRKARS